MIGHLRPKIILLNEREIAIKLALNRRSKNHLNSMYFGALAVGADLAGGLHGFYLAHLAKLNVSLAFKSFEAQFLRRPEADVYFVSTMGDTVQDMITLSASSGERINRKISIKGYINYPIKPELIAEFQLELSLKVLKKS
jgi:hypothetical protein